MSEQQKEITCMEEDAEAISSMVEHIQIDPNDYKGQDVNYPILEWYTLKFDQCIADGVPLAMSAYYEHCTGRNDITPLTKIFVAHEYLNRLQKK